MAGTIKGITIEIGGDTVGLQKALSDVNKKTRDLTGELKQVERALKFDPGNTTLLAQKQQILSEQVENTTEKLNKLKDAQSQVDKQFQSGDIGADQFRAFQREIIQTEGKLDNLRQSLRQMDGGSSVDQVRQDLQKLGDEANDSKGEVGGLASELGNLAGGLAAAGGLQGVVEQAMSTVTQNTKIEISFDVPPESMQSVKNAASTVESYGIDAESALEGVRRQWAMNSDASDESNTAVIKGAAMISAAYEGIDFNELIQETNEMASAMGISNEEAIGLTNALLKTGFPPDQLDILSEYSTQLSTAGFNAEQIQNIFAAGVDTKSWNIDNLMDGLKEGRIKLAEFGQEIPKSMGTLLDQVGISQSQFQKWGQDVAKGGVEGQTAMSEVANALNGVQDQTLRNQLGVAVFGTMYEDQGQNIIDTLLNAQGETANLQANQDLLNESVGKMDASPAVAWSQAMSNMKTALTPVLTVVANFIAKIAEWISKNPELAAGITAILTVMGILIGLCMALQPVFLALSGAATSLGVGMLPLTLTIMGIIVAIGLLIAAGVWLYNHWDEVKAKAKELWTNLQQTFEDIKNAVTTKIDELRNRASEIWQNIKESTVGKAQEIWSDVTTRFTNLKNDISSRASEIWSNVKERFNSIKDAVMEPIRTAVGFVTDQIDKIKGLFSGLSLKLPNIQTPHFSVKNWSLNPADWVKARPYVDIDWYAQGGLFPANSPRLVGMGDASVPEAALPLSDAVLGKIAQMISDRMPGTNGSNLILNIENFHNYTDRDIETLANELNFYLKRMNLAKGGK